MRPTDIVQLIRIGSENPEIRRAFNAAGNSSRVRRVLRSIASAVRPLRVRNFEQDALQILNAIDDNINRVQPIQSDSTTSSVANLGIDEQAIAFANPEDEANRDQVITELLSEYLARHPHINQTIYDYKDPVTLDFLTHNSEKVQLENGMWRNINHDSLNEILRRDGKDPETRLELKPETRTRLTEETWVIDNLIVNRNRQYEHNLRR